MRKMLIAVIPVLALALASPALLAAETGTWSGEVLDLACYMANGAHGADHADCAKTCVKKGQPMGLLTDDGTLVLLAADHKDGAPYEALKDMAGHKAEVTGVMSESAGVKMVTVTGSKAM